MNYFLVFSLIFAAFNCNQSNGAKILEVQTKTNYEDQDAGKSAQNVILFLADGKSALYVYVVNSKHFKPWLADWQ